MLGTQFKGVTGDVDSIKIVDLIKLSNIPAGTFATRSTTAPEIQVLNESGGYTHYYYISDATGGDAAGTWARTKAKATESVALGKGFWFKAPSVQSGATITFAGAVKSDGTKTVDVGNTQWVQICNPFPVDLTFDMMTTALTPGTFATRSTSAPEIQYLTSEGGYTHYYFISDATGGTSAGAWARTKAKATGKLAGVGEAFWVKSSAVGSITFSINGAQ